jgi:hypothetical protein
MHVRDCVALTAMVLNTRQFSLGHGKDDPQAFPDDSSARDIALEVLTGLSARRGWDLQQLGQDFANNGEFGQAEATGSWTRMPLWSTHADAINYQNVYSSADEEVTPPAASSSTSTAKKRKTGPVSPPSKEPKGARKKKSKAD